MAKSGFTQQLHTIFEEKLSNEDFEILNVGYKL